MKLLTATELRKELKISYPTLMKMIAGGLPHHKIGARRFFHMETVMAYTRRGKQV